MDIFLDNIIYSKSKNGGISNYWFELSKYLLNDKKHKISFFEDKYVDLNFHRNILNLDPQSIISNTKIPLVLSRLLPVQHKSAEQFIYHSSYYRGITGSKKAIEVTTVYDFIHNYYSTFLKKTIHNNLKFNAIKRSKGVICISQNTYNDLQKFCPTTISQKAEVIYVGVSDDYFPLDKNLISNQLFLKNHNIETGFLLFIGGRTNYKNFDFVVSVLNDNKDLKLVVVGGGSLTVVENKLFTDDSLKRLTFINNATNQELNILLNNALALLYPSSYEGFGIPVVEAMRAGCPVIGLNNATILEVAGDAGVLLNELNLSEFNAKLTNLYNDEFRREIIGKGFLESKKYSWEKCSRETREFYENLY